MMWCSGNVTTWCVVLVTELLLAVLCNQSDCVFAAKLLPPHPVPVVMDLSDLKVQMLKSQLLARNKDVRGSKAVLVERLRVILQEEGVDIGGFVSRMLGTNVDGPGVEAQVDEVHLGRVGATGSSSPPQVDGSSKLVPRAVDTGSAPVRSDREGFVTASQGVEDPMAARDALIQHDACHEVDIRPEDSISQVVRSSLSGRGSRVSGSLASLKAQEEANRAALRVKMKFLKERQTLERHEHELKLKKEEIQLQEAMERSQAREAALTSSRMGSAMFGAVERSTTLRKMPEPSSLVSKEQVASRRQGVQPVHQSSPRSAELGSLEPGVRAVSQGAVSERNDPQGDLMRKLLTSSLLPKPDIPVFSGDVTQFHQFLRAFDGRVGNIVTSEEDRLYYLEQFTAGTPRDIVRGCMFMKVGGYQEARRLLTKRYGNPDKVSDSFIDRLMRRPLVKADDVDELDRLAVELRTCHNAVSSLMGTSHELDHPKTMRKILEKLPFAIQEKWRRKVDSLAEVDERPAVFSDLVSLVEVEARIASNAAFGRQAFLKKEKPRVEKPRETRTRCNYAASRDTESRKETCVLCKRTHTLDGCPTFAKKSLSEREEFVRQQALCFGCLKPGHRSKWCRSRLVCTVCGKRHPSVLHRYQVGTVSQVDQLRGPVGEAPLPQAAVNVVSAGSGGEVAMKMPIIPVKVRHREGPVVETYAFLDSGSSSTFCSQALLDKLKVPASVKTRLSVTTMAKDPLNVWTAAVEGLVMSDMDENDDIHLPVVFSLDSIPVSKEEVCRLEDITDWPYLHDVVPEDIDAEVGLLVGINVPSALEPVDFIPSRGGGPFAVRTRLGWVVNGPVRNKRWTQMRSTANRIQVEIQQLQLDSDNLASEERGWSVEDHQWLRKVEEGLKMSDGHYELPLPRKSKLPLPDNREVALRRLQSLKKRFDDKEFADKYVNFMNNMFEKGHAEKVPDEDLSRSDGKVSYIPHHGVYGQKPGKIRVVFDCSSAFQGVSLNDSLLQGPDLTTPLFDVLLRFRQEQVAFVGDVESMYYQVRVPQEDRDTLRFFWWPDGNTTLSPEMYRMTVHPFGARSSPSIANYALKRTAEDCGDEYSLVTKQTVEQNFYVDDCLKSVNSVEGAIEVVRELRDLCQRGGFRLTKFVSNSREVLQSIPSDERGKQVRDLALDEDLPAERALGVQWLVEPDVISFAVSRVPEKPCTRRGMLSVIGSVYDPLGMGAPFVLHGRLILQELTRRKFGWDDAAPDDLAAKWTEWLEDIPLLSEACLPRCLKPEGFGSVTSCEIHHFSDASTKGYGVVSYLRFTNDRGEVHCAFVFGKTRLTPLKGMTIPRLELSAAVLAARADVILRRALLITIDRSVFWTDSTTVIRYIRNEHTRFHTFVANRIAVVRDASSPGQWRYVNSAENPADDASRGQSGAAFVTNERWFNGPRFLWKESSMWPLSPSGLDQDLEEDPELKRTVRTALTTADPDLLSAFFQHYSSWHRLQRAVAWILRVKSKLKEKTKKRSTSPHHGVTSACGSGIRRLTVADLRDAELAIFRYVQKTSFAQECATLEVSGCVRSGSSLAPLDPVFVNGLIRVGGRLTNTPLSESQKHPVILPKCHHVVDLIVQQVHEQVGHAGREHVLAELRSQVWVLKSSSAVRRVLSRCLG